jgi:hypothetical protein
VRVSRHRNATSNPLSRAMRSTSPATHYGRMVSA